jgi:hypothetical protein
MQTESTGPNGNHDLHAWSPVDPQRKPIDENTHDDIYALSDGNETHEEGRLDQLPFSDSVKILSEAMKARVKRNAATLENGASASDPDPSNTADAPPSRPVAESLNDLLDALKSALDQAGLEKGNQSTLTRILGDIRTSVQYQPQGKGGIKTGPSPNLLDLSA